MQPERLSIGERASNLFNALTGTWTAALFWTALTAVWWMHSPPPGGWARAIADDGYPFTFWGAIVSYVTLVQEIIIRTGQRAQQRRAERADARQGAIIEAVRQDVDATAQAVLALRRVLAYQEDGTAKVLEQMRLLRAEVQLLAGSSRRAQEQSDSQHDQSTAIGGVPRASDTARANDPNRRL